MSAQNANVTGHIFVQEMPLVCTPVILDPADFKPAKGILTKYGKKLLAQGEKYYGKASISSGYASGYDSEVKAEIVARYPQLKNIGIILTPRVIDPDSLCVCQGVLLDYGIGKLTRVGVIRDGIFIPMSSTLTLLTPEERAKHNAGVAKIHSRYPWLKKK